MVKMASFDVEEGGSDEEVRGSSLLSLVWVGTGGLGGHLLGTDEEEIVYLRFVIYNTSTQQVRKCTKSSHGLIER